MKFGIGTFSCQMSSFLALALVDSVEGKGKVERFEQFALSSVMSVMLSHRIRKRKAAVFVGKKIYCRLKSNASTQKKQKKGPLKNCVQRLKLFSGRESLKKAFIDKSLRRHEDIQ